MPGIQDWRMTPLQNVSEMFEEHVKRRQSQAENGNVGVGINQVHADNGSQSQWMKKVSEFFATKLNMTSSDEEWRKQIPSLNVTTNHHLIDGQMVRFRGMIQVNCCYVMYPFDPTLVGGY